MKEMTFGRGPHNDVVIPDSGVSTRHAKITYLGKGMFEVIDLDSTNGTYVNGFRIRKAQVSINDEITLSDNITLDLSKEFKLGRASAGRSPDKDKKANPEDFTEEFALLEEVYETFKADEKKMELGHHLKHALIAGGLTVIPILVYLLTKDFRIIGLSALVAIIANYFKAVKTNKVPIRTLQSNFRIRYVCPACKTSLLDIPWEDWHKKGRCNNNKCNAIYNKDLLGKR